MNAILDILKSKNITMELFYIIAIFTMFFIDNRSIKKQIEIVKQEIKNYKEDLKIFILEKDKQDKIIDRQKSNEILQNEKLLKLNEDHKSIKTDTARLIENMLLEKKNNESIKVSKGGNLLDFEVIATHIKQLYEELAKIKNENLELKKEIEEINKKVDEEENKSESTDNYKLKY